VVALADPEWGQLVAAAVECDAPASLDTAELAHAVRVELGAASVPRLLRAVRELPLRGIGKPDRARVAELLAEDAKGIPATGTPTPDA
jgi:O-succinylbenzoic acid--CoA ligase